MLNDHHPSNPIGDGFLLNSFTNNFFVSCKKHGYRHASMSIAKISNLYFVLEMLWGDTNCQINSVV